MVSRGELVRLNLSTEQRGVSQRKLTMDLSVNRNSIRRYENAVREAYYATLIKFADYFAVSLDYLLERTDNPTMLK